MAMKSYGGASGAAFCIPCALFWRKAWQGFLERGFRRQNAKNWMKRVFGDLVMNHFIFQRGRARWLAHWLIMWGCITTAAITFPLVLLFAVSFTGLLLTFAFLNFQPIPCCCPSRCLHW